MSVHSRPEGLSEVREWLEVDLSGRPLAPGGESASLQAWARSAAAAANQLAAAGAALRVGALRVALVKGTATARVAAAGPEMLLLGVLDAAAPVAKVQQTLFDWSRAALAEAAPPPVAEAPAAPPLEAPVPGPAPDFAPEAALEVDEVDVEVQEEPVILPATEALPEPVPADPWARLRRSLVRGLLAEAAVQWRAIADAWPSQSGGAAAPAEYEQAVQLLLEGSGAVQAGDGVGGGRLLRGLATLARDQASFQWLARLWSARAAQRSGSLASALAHAQAALRLSHGLDDEARAASQLTTAAVRALVGGDHAGSLDGLAQALETYLQLGDPWGQSRSFLAQARILAAMGNTEESVLSANRAQLADPAWEAPAVFLARIALQDGELDSAERLLSPLRSPGAERELAIVARIREGSVSAEAAAEFLREQESPPGPRTLEVMQRLAQRWPTFFPAREALGWLLLKTGRYAEANAVLRELLGQPLPACDVAWVRLGLGCIANALKRGKPEARLRAAVGDPRRDSGPHAPVPPPGATPPGLPSVSRTVFSGYLGIFALPDLLEFLRSGRRTGLLVCSCAQGLGALRFANGSLTGGGAPGVPNLGELLVRAGAIDAAALEAVTATHNPGRTDPILGEVLVREGKVTAAAVQAAAIAQIRAAVRVLIDWSDGQFAFDREEGEVLEPGNAATSVSLDPQGVLLDLFRERDEELRDEPKQ